MTATSRSSAVSSAKPFQYGLRTTFLGLGVVCVLCATRHPAAMIVSSFALLPTLSFRTQGVVFPGMLLGCLGGHLAALLLVVSGAYLNGGHQWTAAWTIFLPIAGGVVGAGFNAVRRGWTALGWSASALVALCGLIMLVWSLVA